MAEGLSVFIQEQVWIYTNQAYYVHLVEVE